MPDKRLIDANALLEKLGERYLATDPSDPEQLGYLNARIIVRNQPNIDAVPVVHGRWILERIYRKCSLCEWIFCIRDEEGDLQKFNYCPNCGMPMDGGADK